MTHDANELIATYAHVGVQHVMEAEATGEAFDAACDDGGDGDAAWGVDPDRIREARESAGLTQAEVAEATGAGSKATVSKWEVGKSTPSAESIHRLAVRTRRPIEFFFHRAPRQAA